MPLIKPAPAIVRQTMQTAFQNLERTISPNDSRDFHKSTLLSVREEALDIETRLAARQSLRNMRRLMPLFTALEHYSKVVDVLCNGTPFLPWIWAPITLILRIASDYVEAFEQLVKGYSRIAESLQRFEILANVFDGDTQFQQTLAVFYADILEFHKHAYKFVRRNGWRLLFLTSWGRFQRHFDSILEDMKRHEDLIDQEANARNIAEARAMRQELQAWKEERLEKVRLEDERQSAKEYRTLLSWLNIDESDQVTIFESISSQGNRHPGTCMWVTQNPQIRAWLQERPNTPILWLSGTAGSGKSVISTQLVNFTKKAKRSVFYHFCAHASIASSEYDQVLKSLLAQALRQDAEWTAHVHNDLVLKRRTATTSGLEDLLRTILTCSSETSNKYLWVVLDGVDELREESQSRLLNLMKQIPGKASATSGVCCKILISSRPSPTMLRVLGKKPRLSLTDQKKPLTKAIEEYSRQRLRLLDDRFQQLGVESHELDEIGRQVADKADGMFLYARLVLDYISSNIFIHRDELRLSINQLPKELSEFYHKILAQILAPLDTNSVRHIKCVLGWLAFSRRPLKKHELLSAVSFSSGNPDIKLPAPEYILSVCGSLVEERSDATYSFIHVSVKDYLQESSSNLTIHEEEVLQQQCLATVTCLFSSFRLLDDLSDNKYQLIVKGVYDLQVYAYEYWTDYLLCVAESGHGLEAESQLLSVLNGFSERLRLTFQYHSQPLDPPGLDMEARMKHLQHHPELAEHVKRAIQARSLDQLERNMKHQSDIPEATGPETDVDGISKLLASYQQALVHILGQPEIPGISANDMESFCMRSRSSAYTCGLHSCPRATIGFDSATLRDEHQIEHTRKYCCTYPTCQYPPFSSSKILKRHIRANHTAAAPRKTIRQTKDTGATSHGGSHEADALFRPPSRSHMQGTDDLNSDVSLQVSSLSTALYQAELHGFLEERNCTEETCPPKELLELKEKCLTQAVELIRNAHSGFPDLSSLPSYRQVTKDPHPSMPPPTALTSTTSATSVPAVTTPISTDGFITHSPFSPANLTSPFTPPVANGNTATPSPVKKKMGLGEYKKKADEAAASAKPATDPSAPGHFPGASLPANLTQQHIDDAYNRFEELKANRTPPNEPEFIRLQRFLRAVQQQWHLGKQQQALQKKLEQHQQQPVAANNQMFPQGMPQGRSPEQQQMMVADLQIMQQMQQSLQQELQQMAPMQGQMQDQMPGVVTQAPAPPAQAAQPPSPIIEELTAQLDQREEQNFHTPDIGHTLGIAAQLQQAQQPKVIQTGRQTGEQQQRQAALARQRQHYHQQQQQQAKQQTQQ